LTHSTVSFTSQH